MSDRLRMRAGLRWVVAFACLLSVCVIAPGVAFSAEEEQPAAEQSGSSLPLPDEAAINGALDDSLQAHEEELRRREEQLASAASVAEREDSQRAYADLGPDAAEDLFRSVFGPMLEQLDRDPARFLSDAKIERVAGAEGATVTSKGETQLLETSVPVRAEEEDGNLAKVDVTLSPGSEGWEAENPLVDLAIGNSAEEGIEVGDEGLTITQEGAEGATAVPLGDKDLFFPEVTEGADADMIVSPISSGVEIFNLLRSVDSPEALRFELDLPEGAELRAEPGGSAVVVDGDGKVTTLIPKPWALDAQGTSVPVELSVDGDTLVLGVQHRDKDLAYPILVDPTIYQDWGWWYQGQHLSGLGAWRWQQSAGAWWVNHGTEDTGFPGYEGKGLFIATAPGTLQGQQWGQWIYSAPNAGSYLASATINPFWRNNRQCAPSSYYYPYDYDGMWKESSGWAQLFFNNANDQGWSSLSNWGEALIIGMSTDAGTNTYMPCWRDLMIGGVGIWLDDWQIPWMTIFSGPPTNWVKKDSTARYVEVKGTDMGLGVQRFRMTGNGKEWGWDQPYCAGTYEDRCGTERTGKINYTTEAIGAEGKVNLSLQVIDPTDKRGTVERTISIDGTAPTVGLTGTQEPTNYKLAVTTQDGTSAAPRSGVKEAKVYLDGTLKETRTNTCTSSGCPETLNFTYNQPLTGLSLGKHTLEVVAYDQVGYTKTATTTFSVDQPDTFIDSGPSGLTNDSTPTFTYHSTLAGSTFQCAVDGGAYVSCPSTGYTTPVLIDGPHTFSVKATSGAGYTDPTPATRSFTVDTVAPNTTIDYGPEGATKDATPTFGFSSDDPDANFECKFDAAAYKGCSGSFEAETALADGAHTFTVRAKDRAANIDATPATRSFSVDSTSPTVKIETGPSGPTKTNKPTFTFTSSGASTLRCAIDAEATEGPEPSYGACTTSTSHTPLAPLSDGPYTFRVLVSDAAGNQALDLREFRVDTLAPQTTINSGPADPTDDTKPAFTFSSNESPSTYQCRFDAQAFAACSGPGASHASATAMADGYHSFEVRAIDAAGNTDPTPAVRTFTISTGGPQTTITAGPEGAIAQTSATFKYVADEAATFQCRLDGAAFLSCPAGEKSYTALTEGRHVFEVRAVNSGAVVDPTPASRSYVVDTSAPPAPQTSGPMREPSVPGLNLHIEAEDGSTSSNATTRSGVQSLLIYADGVLIETLEARCTQAVCQAEMVRTAQLPHKNVIGSHLFEVRARDGVGNTSAPATWSENTAKAGTLVDTEPTASASASGSDCPGPIETIRAHENEALVRGTGGRDLIISAPGVVNIKAGAGCDIIVGSVSQEKIRGGAGDDVIRGGRSDDFIRGDAGDDQIYGGVGDDHLLGRSDNDVLDGGPGSDRLLGGGDNDTIRGGQGQDELSGGPKDNDTLSYADVLPPGFASYQPSLEKAQNQNIGGFPDMDESGVYINFNESPARAFSGPVSSKGGVDKLLGAAKGDFERVVGSAFSDWIEGNAGITQIDSGQGADLIVESGGAEVNPGPGGNSVNGTPGSINPRDADSTSILLGVQEPTKDTEETDVYMIGGKAGDRVSVKATGTAVKFTARDATVKSHMEPLGICNNVKGTRTVSCKVGRLGAVVVYGGRGSDRVNMAREQPRKPGTIALDGGPGSDRLFGLGMEELLVDGGNGDDVLHGGGGDDAIFQGEGSDEVAGDGGSDLIVSSRVCGGDHLYGDKEGGSDTGADNAQFAPLAEDGVWVDLEEQKVGKVGGDHKCGPLEDFNDAEGSKQRDVIYGTNGPNLLIGRDGKDSLFGKGRKDRLNGNDNEEDEKIDCGGQKGDIAIVDGIDVTKHAVLHRDCRNIRAKKGKGQGRISIWSVASSEPPLMGEVSEPGERPSLTSYFGFNETSGTTAGNDIEEGKNGTYKAVGVGPSVNGPGPTLGAAGALVDEDENSAVKLDGVDDYVDLAGAGLPAESEEGPYSVAMFVKFSRLPGQVEYLFSGFGSGQGVFLFRDAAGRMVFATGLEPGAPRVRSAEPIKDEAWHQVVGTLDGENITVNVDGFPYTLGYGSPVAPEKQPNQSLVGAGPGVVQLLAGSVDELGVFEGALSESEAFGQLGESEAEEPSLLLAPAPETADADGDGVTDGVDNCPMTSNADQVDVDENGIGDACEPPDGDGDGVTDPDDNCPYEYNPDQADANGDGLGDECAGMPPEADTAAATNVKGSSASLNATVDPEGAATSYQFEYGTTTAYGTTVPVTPKSAGTGVDPVAVSEAISGLQPGTTYHYRIVAWSEAGESEGEDVSFTTPKAPTVTTKAATSVQATSAVFNGTVNPEGDATTYQFEYGKSTAYGSKAPATAKSAGSGTSTVSVSETVSGLEPGTTYHYRLVATNSVGTSKGSDVIFKTTSLPVTGAQLLAMPVTHPFNGSTASLSDFASKWAALGWAVGPPPKGEDSVGGWHPVEAFPSPAGAYFTPSLTDTGEGVAAVATLAGAPTITERYFSLWLDMTSPSSTTKAGYELRFTETASNVYTATLSKWAKGAQTVLASKTAYSLPVGSSFAIVDQGSTVSAWTKTSGGFGPILSATDSTYDRGTTGIEGAGNILRLSDFKAGVPLTGATNMNGALSALELNDSFASNEVPLSGGGSWSALQWDNSAFETDTGQVSGGWGPYDAFPTINGAFWQPAAFTDTGAGVASAATLTSNGMITERYFSLWVDMPTPGLTRSGYELRFTETASNVYTATLSRWQSGAKTVLATKTGYTMALKSQFALVDKGGTVSAWVKSGTEFLPLLSAADTAFYSGYTGIEASGNIIRLSDFRSGPLPPF
jgi:Ca2+-binding RTX toxin-like protein